MKKTAILILSISLIMFLFSCGNTETKTESNENELSNLPDEKVVENENVEKNNENLPDFKIKAKFDMVIASSDGAVFLFEDESGKSIEFFDKDKPQKLSDITNGVMPNEHDSKFDNIWFNIEYQQQTVEFYDGGTGKNNSIKVNVITSIEEISKGKTSVKGITLDDLINAKFFGKEKPWALEFKKDYILYTDNIGEETQKYFYRDNPKIKNISNKKISINAKTEFDFWITYTITKQDCSDGESDKVYDYSIEVEDEIANHSGCGRILK